MAWRANIDIQPVLNPCKAVSSEAMQQVAKEVKNMNLNLRDKMKKVSHAFLSTSTMLGSGSSVSNRTRIVAAEMFSGYYFCK